MITRRRLCAGALALPLTLIRPASAAPVVHKDLSYGEFDGEQLLLDVYRPEARGTYPTVIVIHGGGWQGGDKKGHVHTCTWLAENGFTAVNVNYRLAPKHRYPAAVDDCQRAVRWVRYHARHYGVDPERVGALGDSAGGHLASLLGLIGTRNNRDTVLSGESSRVRAVVNYFGPSDLVRMWDVEAVRPLLTAWLGGSPQEQSTRYRDASPLMAVQRGAAPFLILHGDQDRLVPEEQSRLLHEALRKHNVESTLRVFTGAGHGWPADSEHGQASGEAILAFFNKHLKR
jgi:acetyl esterase/lipase